MICSLSFYSFGFGFSFKAYGGFIGTEAFFCQGFSQKDLLLWIYYLGYSILTASVASGSIGERCFLDVYLMFSFLVSGLIYPVTASWVWGDGWLHRIGAIEGAGVGPTHVLGGVLGLVGAIFVGSREGVFQNKKSIDQTKAT